MAVPQISPLPEHPSRGDAPQDFTQKADTWVSAMQPMTDQVNAGIAFVNGRAVDADASAQAAASSENAASASAGAAGAAEAAAVPAANAAVTAASEAEQSASAADGSAQAAAQSAISAGTSESSASDSAALALAAKDAAEAAADGKTRPLSSVYTYDRGLVIKITDDDVFDTVIDYNDNGTVNTITYPGGRIETFAYDSLGNVTSMTATGGDV